MKKLRKTIYAPTVLLLLATLTLLAAGCAAPQLPNGLQQRVDELLQIQQQQAQQLAQLQQQLAQLSGAHGDSSTVAGGPVAAPQQQAQASNPQLLPLQVSASATEIAELSEAAALYLEAFAALATGQMAKAESGFQTFIQRYPKHQYTGNASYWMAEALLAQQKTTSAEGILLRIIDNPEQQNRAPAAMARLIGYYRESDAQDNAAAMLQLLSTRYPESPELQRLMRSTKAPLTR